VKGGVKVQRLAEQDCDTSDLPTPPDTGCQFVSVHISYASPEADGFGISERFGFVPAVIRFRRPHSKARQAHGAAKER